MRWSLLVQSGPLPQGPRSSRPRGNSQDGVDHRSTGCTRECGYVSTGNPAEAFPQIPGAQCPGDRGDYDRPQCAFDEKTQTQRDPHTGEQRIEQSGVATYQSRIPHDGSRDEKGQTACCRSDDLTGESPR